MTGFIIDDLTQDMKTVATGIMQTSKVANFKRRFHTTFKAYKVTIVQNSEIDLERWGMGK